MEQNDDLWLKQWKEVLDDYEEEVPVGGWEKLQTDLQADDPLGQESSHSAKIIPFQRWKVVAAAAVVVLVAGAGIWFLSSDKAQQVAGIETPLAQVMQGEGGTNLSNSEESESLDEQSAKEEVIATQETKPAVTQEVKPAIQETKAATTPETKPVASSQQNKTVATTQQSKPVTAQKTTPVATQEPAKQPELIAQASAQEPKAVEEKREGTRIEVRSLPREQMQRSTNPTSRQGGSDQSSVSTVNKRKVQVSSNPALQGVTMLNGNGGATTRADVSGEITDMDRVYNSFTNHYDELYSQKEHLFDNGTGDYSTVDNALFIAALVKKMQGKRSNDDVKLYREMASRLVELQQSNGLWKSSLLNPNSRNVDTDTDSYICYALAWGVNNGILSRSQYLESVRKAWQSIGNCNSEPCRMAKEEMSKIR